MGSHVGVIFPFLKYQFKKTNTRIVHNPAGMEWKRKKYNFIMRKYSYLSRMIFIRTSVDCLVSDNPGVFRFYKDKFKRSAKNKIILLMELTKLLLYLTRCLKMFQIILMNLELGLESTI